jgi:LPXTG-motif cell wall-anchored protein
MVYFVSFHDPSDYGYECVTFNVTDAATKKLSVQQDSYIADLPANLPDTGIALVFPAMGAAASAGGLILLRRRLS